ncbi:zf-TFIIB domain-containing protein [Candidatus Riflebacteria bacterium]
MLKCPRCKTSLNTVLYEKVEIETCPGCEGEWLDCGELEKIVNTVEESFSEAEKEEVNTFIQQTNFKMIQDHSAQLDCANCLDQKLDRLNFAGSTPVAIDKCPICKGVWLDKGELEAVQILVEGWDSKIDEDIAEFGTTLKKIRKKYFIDMRKAVSISKSTAMNFIFWTMFRSGFR